MNIPHCDYLVLSLLGVRVREVSDLAERAIWLDEERLLFVDHDLTPEDREKMVCLVLGRLPV